MAKTNRIEIKKGNDIMYPYYGEVVEGSEIVVSPGCCAIYLKDGDYEIFNAGTDVIGEKKKFFSKGKSAPGELYGVNMDYVQEIKFGVGDINVIEKLTGKPITFGASGTYKIQISNPIMLAVRLLGSVSTLTTDELRRKLKGEVTMVAKKIFGEILIQFGRYELDSSLMDISENFKLMLYPKFEFYGVKLVDLSIENYTEVDPEFRALIDTVATQKYTHGQLKDVLADMRQDKLDEANFSLKLAEALAAAKNGKNTYRLEDKWH